MFAVSLALASGSAYIVAHAQVLTYSKGQPISAAYEGWRVDPDGAKYFIFGYENKNWEEEMDIPVGPDNGFQPGPADRGQPTHFDTRRHKDIFRVIVPKDFGENNKLVWTVTVRGKAESISGTLNRVWQIDRDRTTRCGNSQSIDSNHPPEVKVQPATLSVNQAGAAKFSISATDDGLPKRRGETVGMTVEWEKYRGPGIVTFNQIKQPLKDGKADVTASFSEPGSYVLMAVVDDGSGESAGNFGYHCCWTNVQVTVTVTGGGATGGR